MLVPLAPYTSFIVEVNLGESGVTQLSEKLKGTFLTPEL